jgi:hypothetical protein
MYSRGITHGRPGTVNLTLSSVRSRLVTRTPVSCRCRAKSDRQPHLPPPSTYSPRIEGNQPRSQRGSLALSPPPTAIAASGPAFAAAALAALALSLMSSKTWNPSGNPFASKPSVTYAHLPCDASKLTTEWAHVRPLGPIASRAGAPSISSLLHARGDAAVESVWTQYEMLACLGCQRSLKPQAAAAFGIPPFETSQRSRELGPSEQPVSDWSRISASVCEWATGSVGP